MQSIDQQQNNSQSPQEGILSFLNEAFNSRLFFEQMTSAVIEDMPHITPDCKEKELHQFLAASQLLSIVYKTPSLIKDEQLDKAFTCLSNSFIAQGELLEAEAVAREYVAHTKNRFPEGSEYIARSEAFLASVEQDHLPESGIVRGNLLLSGQRGDSTTRADLDRIFKAEMILGTISPIERVEKAFDGCGYDTIYEDSLELVYSYRDLKVEREGRETMEAVSAVHFSALYENLANIHFNHWMLSGLSQSENLAKAQEVVESYVTDAKERFGIESPLYRQATEFRAGFRKAEGEQGR